MALLGPECTFSNLALSLALIAVGAPVFGLHWFWIQRGVSQEEDERQSLLRAGALYGFFLATLIPAAQNALAMVNRAMLQSETSLVCRPLIGGDQTWTDNLIAIGLNLLLAGYFFLVLQKDWCNLTETRQSANARRLFRYLMVIYGLVLTLIGLNQVLHFLLPLPYAVLGSRSYGMLVNGLAL